MTQLLLRQSKTCGTLEEPKRYSGIIWVDLNAYSPRNSSPMEEKPRAFKCPPYKHCAVAGLGRIRGSGSSGGLSWLVAQGWLSSALLASQMWLDHYRLRRERSGAAGGVKLRFPSSILNITQSVFTHLLLIVEARQCGHFPVGGEEWISPPKKFIKSCRNCKIKSATAFNKLVLEVTLTETRQCLIQTSSSVVKREKKQTQEWRELLEHEKPAENKVWVQDDDINSCLFSHEHVKSTKQQAGTGD